MKRSFFTKLTVSVFAAMCLSFGQNGYQDLTWRMTPEQVKAKGYVLIKSTVVDANTVFYTSESKIKEPMEGRIFLFFNNKLLNVGLLFPNDKITRDATIQKLKEQYGFVYFDNCNTDNTKCWVNVNEYLEITISILAGDDASTFSVSYMGRKIQAEREKFLQEKTMKDLDL